MFEGPSATRWTPDKFYCSDSDGATRVEVDISGDIDGLVAQDKFKVLKDFVFEDEGQRVLRLERSSELRTVVQNGRDKKVDVKAVCFWYPEREKFENVTGIDAKVKAIFDFEAVWANAQPGDHIDFANNKSKSRSAPHGPALQPGSVGVIHAVRAADAAPLPAHPGTVPRRWSSCPTA